LDLLKTGKEKPNRKKGKHEGNFVETRWFAEVLWRGKKRRLRRPVRMLSITGIGTSSG